MMNRFGLDRFKKAQSAEPFSLKASTPTFHPPKPQFQVPAQPQTKLPDSAALSVSAVPPVAATSIGAGESNWQPPEWTVDPKPGVYWLEVVKDGDVVDKISLDKRRCIFGRQSIMCDLVLDHPSVSRQHAAVVQHKNGGIYVIDLGSVHGTFVANERLTKDNPVELEVGQSLRFAASTRIYVLRKTVPTPVVPVPPPTNIVIPPPPDASDEEAVLAHNTLLNRLGVPCPTTPMLSTYSTTRKAGAANDEESINRPSKKARKSRVSFRDDYGGVLVDVVGISDGADVSTEPGPIGVKEGSSLVGKYESLVQVTVIPKGQEDARARNDTGTSQGVTKTFQQYLEKVKAPGKGGLYGELYGEALAGIVGRSWAGGQNLDGTERGVDGTSDSGHQEKEYRSASVDKSTVSGDAPRDSGLKSKTDVDEDLFGDDDDLSDGVQGKDSVHSVTYV